MRCREGSRLTQVVNSGARTTPGLLGRHKVTAPPLPTSSLMSELRRVGTLSLFSPGPFFLCPESQLL